MPREWRCAECLHHNPGAANCCLECGQPREEEDPAAGNDERYRTMQIDVALVDPELDVTQSEHGEWFVTDCTEGRKRYLVTSRYYAAPFHDVRMLKRLQDPIKDGRLHGVVSVVRPGHAACSEEALAFLLNTPLEVHELTQTFSTHIRSALRRLGTRQSVAWKRRNIEVVSTSAPPSVRSVRSASDPMPERVSDTCRAPSPPAPAAPPPPPVPAALISSSRRKRAYRRRELLQELAELERLDEEEEEGEAAAMVVAAVGSRRSSGKVSSAASSVGHSGRSTPVPVPCATETCKNDAIDWRTIPQYSTLNNAVPTAAPAVAPAAPRSRRISPAPPACTAATRSPSRSPSPNPTVARGRRPWTSHIPSTATAQPEPWIGAQGFSRRSSGATDFF